VDQCINISELECVAIDLHIVTIWRHKRYCNFNEYMFTVFYE